MRMGISSSAGKSKLKYEDIQDLILSEKVCRKDSSEASCFDAALNLETNDKGYGGNSNRGRSRSRKGISESGFGNQPEC
jgi:hypothetical protein